MSSRRSAVQRDVECRDSAERTKDGATEVRASSGDHSGRGMDATRAELGLGGRGSPDCGVPFGRELAWLFGLDLDEVEVSCSARSELDSMGAIAAAEAGKISFSSGRPSKRDVAHEMAHLAQFNLGGPTMAQNHSQPEEVAEREADAAAAAALAGKRPKLSHRPSARVMRKKKTNAGRSLTHQKLNDSGEVGARVTGSNNKPERFRLSESEQEVLVYDSGGKQLGSVDPRALNSSAQGGVMLNRHRRRMFADSPSSSKQVCRVYAFSMVLQNGDDLSGWINLSSVEGLDVLSKVGQNKEGKKVSNVRSRETRKFRIAGATIENRQKYKDLRVTRRSEGDRNRCAQDYLGGDGDVVNMTIGIPGLGGGISTHSFVGDETTEFHAVNGLYYDVPLWRWGQNPVQAGRVLRFLYGYVELDNEKVWGWMARPALKPV